MLGAAGAVEAYIALCVWLFQVPYNLNLENEIYTKNINFIKGKPLELDLLVLSPIWIWWNKCSSSLEKFNEINQTENLQL